MLLMHKIRQLQPAKVFYLKSSAAIVSTLPMTTWKDFFEQRRRWGSKTLIYDDKRLIAVLVFCVVAKPVTGLLFRDRNFSVALPYIWPLISTRKNVVEYPFVKSVAAFYNQQHLMHWFIFSAATACFLYGVCRHLEPGGSTSGRGERPTRSQREWPRHSASAGSDHNKGL
jgi:hypothetical protein